MTTTKKKRRKKSVKKLKYSNKKLNFVHVATLAGIILILLPENASKLQKMLQISHQKGRFAIDSLVIIGV